MHNPAQFLANFLFIFLLFNGYCTSIAIAIANANPTAGDTKIYIVYLGEKPHNDQKLIKESHIDLLARVFKSKEEAKESVIYHYKYSFSGFAAKLTESQAKQLAGLPGVIRVSRDRHHQVKTSRSWDFLGLSADNANGNAHHNNNNSNNNNNNNNINYDNLLKKTNMGGGSIIGVIDSGLEATGPSFSDEGLGPVPGRWKGICKSIGDFNATEQCNRKVIGARWFFKGAVNEFHVDLRSVRRIDNFSAKDVFGHGTQVASIAAGSFVDNVNYSDLNLGMARGGAPRARLAVYKVCWLDRESLLCSGADVLAAFDYAIRDGVDVISISIGSSVPLASDVETDNGIGIGSFHAVAHGIPVVTAAGNDGPSSFSVTNVEPWLLTVAASTMDRAFLYPITLGNRETIMVDSYNAIGTPISPLVYLGRYVGVEELEQISLNKTEVDRGILFIFGSVSDDQQSLLFKAYDAGAMGVIYSNPINQNPIRKFPQMAFVQVDLEAGTRIQEYIFRTENPTAQLGFSTIYTGKAINPRIPTFSSRGPNSFAPAILKPDIAAPGEKIVCATVQYDPLYENGYKVASGTSQAAPHVAAIVSLLKLSHPNWSPAAIKSAIVTTAWNSDTYASPIFAGGSSDTLADAFDYGGGIVNANGADDPGLVYDMGRTDYINYDCSFGYYSNSDIYSTTKETPNYDVKQEQTICPKTKPSVLDINLPSIVVPNLVKPVTLHRTVTNVGDASSVYKAVIKSPSGITVSVKPNVLRFDSNTKKISFAVTISAIQEVNSGFAFGSLTWTDGVHHVRSPIAVRKQFVPIYF